MSETDSKSGLPFENGFGAADLLRHFEARIRRIEHRVIRGDEEYVMVLDLSPKVVKVATAEEAAS